MDKDSGRRAEFEKLAEGRSARRAARRLEYRTRQFAEWVTHSDARLLSFKFAVVLIVILLVMGLSAAITAMLALTTNTTFDYQWDHGGRLMSVVVTVVVLTVVIVSGYRKHRS